jgi:hypothetical protein
MVVLRHVVAPEGVAAGRGYSQVVTGRGRLVVVSGQIAQDEPDCPGGRGLDVHDIGGECPAAIEGGEMATLTLETDVSGPATAGSAPSPIAPNVIGTNAAKILRTSRCTRVVAPPHHTPRPAVPAPRTGC